MTTDKLKKYVLPNLPYLPIFWFFDKLGMAYRLAPGADLGAKFLNLMKTVNAAFSSPMPSFHPRDLLVGLIGTAVIFTVVAVKKKNAKKFRKDVEYGSARWSA